MEIFDLADSIEILDLSNNHLSTLPEAFGQLKNLRVVFFTNNEFEDFPAVLSTCPQLSMVSFKSNKLKTIGEHLSPTIRWLILTDNQIEALPTTIGRLGKLQKLMLAGNQLQFLPNELAACQNLELIRLAANRLQELPEWLFNLPRLSWLACAGNPCCDAAAMQLKSQRSLLTIDWSELQLENILGQGASGVIYKGHWTSKTAQSASSQQHGSVQSQEVAIKLFKGEVTSDGLPLDEMHACIAAGSHPNLVHVLGKVSNAPEGKAGLVFSMIPSEYENLGNPPDLNTCTRDTYRADAVFTLPMILQITQGIAAAAAHLHATGIMHGDLYAHNILVNEAGESFLGDFGAAFFYNPTAASMGPALERLEVRAFGCLLEDLLDRCPSKSGDHQADVSILSSLRRLQQDCMHPQPTMRPLFSTICKALANL